MIGVPFYIMERIEGFAPVSPLPVKLTRGFRISEKGTFDFEATHTAAESTVSKIVQMIGSLASV